MKMNKLPWGVVLVPLAVFVIFSYGVWISRLGIYWDDWAYLWTRLELGFDGLVRHFSFSRPVAGQIHNLAILLTQGNPIFVQLYGLILRIFAAWSVGWLVKTLWRDNRSAALGALIFIIYPGFSMQPIGINFGFSFLLIGILCLSFTLTIQALHLTHRRTAIILAATLLCTLNLFASEYFFLLELLRPLLIWFVLSENESNSLRLFSRTIKVWLPYGVVFALGTLYRLFFNRTQTLHYEFSLFNALKSDPLHTLGLYVLNMLQDVIKVLFIAWKQIFIFPPLAIFGKSSTLLMIGGALIATLCTFLFLLWLDKGTANNRQKRRARQMIAMGIVAILLGGQAFWLTGSSLSFVFQNSRYTLPFMLGVTLVWCAWFALIPERFWLAVALFVALIFGMSTAYHFRIANEYRRDWTLTKDFFTQLAWRIPSIEPNTVLVTNQLPIRFSTDNSLTAALNWIYAPGDHGVQMPLMLYTNAKRENTLSFFSANQPIFQEYLSAQFFGNTNNVVSIYYQAPGCVRVLDPEVDGLNQMLPLIDREVAILNNAQRIVFSAPDLTLPQKLFGEPQPHNWCAYFEKADLARQRKDWAEAARLGDESAHLADQPNDPMERMVFIESYAHIGNWNQAQQWTEKAYAVTPLVNDPLCALWNRIERETEDNLQKTAVISQVQDMLDCSFLK